MNILRLMIKNFPAFPKITSPTGVHAIVFESKEETGGVQACCDDGVITQSNGSTFWIPMDWYKVTSTPTKGAVLTDRLNAIRKEILENRFDVSKMETITLIQSQKKFTGCSPRKKGACKCKGGRCGKRCGCSCKRRNGNMSCCSSSCSCNGNCSNQIKM